MTMHAVLASTICMVVIAGCQPHNLVSRSTALLQPVFIVVPYAAPSMQLILSYFTAAPISISAAEAAPI